MCPHAAAPAHLPTSINARTPLAIKTHSTTLLNQPAAYFEIGSPKKWLKTEDITTGKYYVGEIQMLLTLGGSIIMPVELPPPAWMIRLPGAIRRACN